MRTKSSSYCLLCLKNFSLSSQAHFSHVFLPKLANLGLCTSGCRQALLHFPHQVALGRGTVGSCRLGHRRGTGRNHHRIVTISLLPWRPSPTPQLFFPSHVALFATLTFPWLSLSSHVAPEKSQLLVGWCRMVPVEAQQGGPWRKRSSRSGPVCVSPVEGTLPTQASLPGGR